jgi:hypothetical protein
MASKQRFFIIAPESKAAREQCSLTGMALTIFGRQNRN